MFNVHAIMHDANATHLKTNCTIICFCFDLNWRFSQSGHLPPFLISTAANQTPFRPVADYCSTRAVVDNNNCSECMKIQKLLLRRLSQLGLPFGIEVFSIRNSIDVEQIEFHTKYKEPNHIIRNN